MKDIRWDLNTGEKLWHRLTLHPITREHYVKLMIYDVFVLREAGHEDSLMRSMTGGIFQISLILYPDGSIHGEYSYGVANDRLDNSRSFYPKTGKPDVRSATNWFIGSSVRLMRRFFDDARIWNYSDKIDAKVKIKELRNICRELLKEGGIVER